MQDRYQEIMKNYFNLERPIEAWSLTSLKHLELITDLEKEIQEQIPIQIVIDTHNHYDLLLNFLQKNIK